VCHPGTHVLENSVFSEKKLGHADSVPPLTFSFVNVIKFVYEILDARLGKITKDFMEKYRE
jgi:hypothetical protein